MKNKRNVLGYYKGNPISIDIVDITFPDGSVIPVNILIAKQVEEMCKKSIDDNLETPLGVLSGYRSFETQMDLFTNYPHPKYVALPGHSMHQLGVSIDFKNTGPIDTVGLTDTSRWLEENAYLFGGKRYVVESWHYTFQPKEAK